MCLARLGWRGHDANIVKSGADGDCPRRIVSPHGHRHTAGRGEVVGATSKEDSTRATLALMAYRSAPRASTVVLTCFPLVAWRALASALASVLAAAGAYAAFGLAGVVLWGPLLLLTILLLRAGVLRSAHITLRVDPRRRRLWVCSARGIEHELDVGDVVAVGVEA